MSIDLRRLVPALAAVSAVAVLAVAPATAADAPAKAVEQFGKRLPKICAELQARGWGVPTDLLKMDPRTKAERRVASIYYCNVAQPLAGKGPGRAPDIAALLMDGGGEPSLILSASVWCAADRQPALEALAKEVERVLDGAGIPVPLEVLTAIRAAKPHEGDAGGHRYVVEPVKVDAQACSRVAAGELGAVLMKIDVQVEPAV